jgi:GNAT superfamily N-acetyltransferase
VQSKATSEIRLRLAADVDAGAISSLLFESFVEYQPLYTPGGFAATAITGEQIISRIAEGPAWVAVLDELIVGTVSVVPQGESLYIRGMAVLPCARGMRIGAALLTQVEQFALAGNFKRLVLSTTPFLDRAIQLYEHFGLRRTTQGTNALFGTPLFTMEKVLRN